jgi:hypothetical protein
MNREDENQLSNAMVVRKNGVCEVVPCLSV